MFDLRYQGKFVEHFSTQASAQAWIDARDPDSRTGWTVGPELPVRLYQQGRLIEKYATTEEATAARDAKIAAIMAKSPKPPRSRSRAASDPASVFAIVV